MTANIIRGRKMRIEILFIAGALASQGVWAFGFEEAKEVCSREFGGIQSEMSDDGQNTFGTLDRINVAWTRNDGDQNICSVNTETRQIADVSLRGKVLTGAQFRNARASLQASEDRLKASKSNPQEYISKTLSRVIENFKDPESTRFQNVYLDKSGTVCGELNGKNSYGAYVGYKGFLASVTGHVYIDGKGDDGFMYQGLVKSSCSNPDVKHATPDGHIKTPSYSSSVADELLKLSKLQKQGVLTKAEFEAQKKKLLNN